MSDESDESKPEQIVPARRYGFQKGVSGNPLGRPRIAVVVQRAAKEEGLRCIAKLIELRDTSKNEKIQFMAAQALLERGFGKPRETPQDDTEVIELSQINTHDIDKALE